MQKRLQKVYFHILDFNTGDLANFWRTQIISDFEQSNITLVQF